MSAHIGSMTETTPIVTVKFDLPDHLGVPRASDGSLAQVTVAVEAETMALAEAGLQKLHEDLNHYSADWLRSVLTGEQLAELGRTGDIPASVLDAMDRIHSEFLTLPAVLEFTELAEHGLTTHTVRITLTSPSVTIAVRSYLEMMEPQRRSLMLRNV